MTNKSQASLEIATTYGWAILIILIVITSIIIYGNTQDAQTFTQDCRLGPQFFCEKVFLDEYGQFEVQLRNNINEQIIIYEANFTNTTVQCPALPVIAKQGGIGRIQCNIQKTFERDTYESLDFKIGFQVRGSTETFVTNSKVETQVMTGLNTFEILCDADGDGKDKFGCGDDSDCNDLDPDLWFSECRQDSDCPLGNTCENAGSCNAYCLNTCDVDEDGIPNNSCGGRDCNDNDDQIGGPICNRDSNCGTGNECVNDGTCASYCRALTWFG